MTRSRHRSEAGQRVRISRRGFVGGSAATLAGLATGGLGACTTGDDQADDAGPTSSPTTAPQRARTFFTPTEARLVEAATARILPGTPDDPGAREAEVVVYIDGLLATGGGYGEPVYRSGPFMGPDDDDPTGDDPRPDGEEVEEDDELGSSGFGVIDRPGGAFARYGDQSLMTPAEAYRAGLPALDRHALDRFGAGFVGLEEVDQDAVLADLERGEAPTFDGGEPTAQDLFELLRRHTVEGMFSDPLYGGNRGKVGWYLIGWPAAQRAYTPDELLAQGPGRTPQSIEELHPFNPGIRDRSGPELPVAGSERHDHRGGG